LGRAVGALAVEHQQLEIAGNLIGENRFEAAEDAGCLVAHRDHDGDEGGVHGGGLGGWGEGSG